MNQKVLKAKEGIWAFLNSKAGIGIICALLAGGGSRLLPLLGFGSPDGMPMPMQPPLACATAMREMAVSLGKVQAVLEEQGKRTDRLEAKIDRMNDRLDYRVAERRPNR